MYSTVHDTPKQNTIEKRDHNKRSGSRFIKVKAITNIHKAKRPVSIIPKFFFRNIILVLRSYDPRRSHRFPSCPASKTPDTAPKAYVSVNITRPQKGHSITTTTHLQPDQSFVVDHHPQIVVPDVPTRFVIGQLALDDPEKNVGHGDPGGIGDTFEKGFAGRRVCVILVLLVFLLLVPSSVCSTSALALTSSSSSLSFKALRTLKSSTWSVHFPTSDVGKSITTLSMDMSIYHPKKSSQTSTHAHP